MSEDLPQHRTTDPYRALFLQLPAGAARCRLIVDKDQVVGTEILDENCGFAQVRGALPRLLGVLSRVRASGAAETVELRGDAAVLTATTIFVGNDEAIVTIVDITERARLAQHAHDWQVRFEQAFHGNAAAMVIASRDDLRILDVNPRWLHLFGATRDEVIGRTSVELGLITETRAQTRIAEHRVFGEGYDVELELFTRRGTRITVLASARPIEIVEGHCTLTTLIDITDRKRAEEAFAVAFSASPAGMLLVDHESDVVVAVNHRLLEMMHRERDDFIGRRSAELQLAVSPPRAALLAEIEHAGRLDGVEIELWCKDGPGVRTLATLASTEMVALHDRMHRLSVFTDITARKRIERRLLTQHAVGARLAEIAELEAAIPGVLEALGSGEGWDAGAVWLPTTEASGAAGPMRCGGTWHSTAVTADGAAAADRAGRARGIVDRVLATGLPEKIAVEPASTSTEATAVAAGLSWIAGFPILRGSTVLGVVTLAALNGDRGLDTGERGLFDSLGRMLGLFVERTRAERALRELNAELERRVAERTEALEATNRDLEAFSTSVSHDLRAPLRAIRGFSEILLEDFATALPAEAKDLLSRIHASGDRLRGQIDGMLAFALLGRDALRPTRVEIDPLVRSVVDELLAGRALGDRLVLRVLPLGSCYADAALLRTVWTNLVDNALKYAQHRERIEIEIGSEPRGNEVVYYVADNGVGFDMANADRLFQVFQRLHRAGEFEGTGIGLANVRRIIERHRGRITATSQLGHGSRFEFTLGPE